MKYITPECGQEAFTCPNCGAYAQQENWGYDFNGDRTPHLGEGELPFGISKCTHCEEFTIWRFNEMVFPKSRVVPLPNEDMPPEVKKEYEEASAIFSKSPRGSAALIRLGIQKLCVSLGGGGENLNQDINKLVKEGLPERIQQALDAVRVIGNNAVHPGQINTDDPKIAQSLFHLVNIIVDYMITKPKQVSEIYSSLPQGALESIKKRDKVK